MLGLLSEPVAGLTFSYTPVWHANLAGPVSPVSRLRPVYSGIPATANADVRYAYEVRSYDEVR